METICVGETRKALGGKYEYKIIHGFDNKLLQEYDKQSTLFYMKFYNELFKNGYSDEDIEKAVNSLMIEDMHWKWNEKSKRHQSDKSYRMFSFIVNDSMQATCLIHQPKKSVLQDGDIFYVEYISVAPWNRKMKIVPRVYQGIGTILLANVLKYAINELNLKPGFSLSSLPQATGYYESLGMERYKSKDEYYNGVLALAFYETPHEKAIELLGENQL